MSSRDDGLPSPGDIVTSTFNPPIVAASYFASLCGCLLTVELLHRRGTGWNSIRACLESLACATSMGAIGIWCMHFIGNRAIILGDDTPRIQLVYNPGYTVLSAFLPIMGLAIAFTAAEFPSRSRQLQWIQSVCTGTIAGLSVVGMHYIGNFGVSNYSLQYEPRFLAASMIIAIGDCLIVLVLFYSWREKWISRWWKRMVCAIFLAGGISAMHFTASTRCIYRLREYNQPGAIRSRDIQVIIAGVLCGTAAVIVLCVLLYYRKRAKVLRDRSQKVMLACVVFDPEGRLMVTTEGVLPSREITEKYHHRTFSEDFDTAHPVFQWIFRVTRNWNGIVNLIPKMKAHLNAHMNLKEEDSRPPSSSSSSASYDPDTYSDYSIIFRELFCIAAASLAASMHIPVDKLGVLYDNIIETGTLKPDDSVGRRNTMSAERMAVDIETGLQLGIFGKGQVMFLTRQLDAEECSNMLNAGFKFANTQQVGRNIAGTMQIPLGALEWHLSDLQRYVDNLATSVDKLGTRMACFVTIPKPNSKGFDVAVQKDDQNRLPDVQLLPYGPRTWHTKFLQQMHDRTAANCIAFLERPQRHEKDRSDQEHEFAQVLLAAMMKLARQLPVAWFQHARFLSRSVQAHYSQPLIAGCPVTTLFAFVYCADLHNPAEACANITRVPLSFYTIRHQCHAGSPNNLVLQREIHQEFGPLFSRKSPSKQRGHRARKITLPILDKLGTHSAINPTTRPHQSESDRAADDASSDTFKLVDKPARRPSLAESDAQTGAERNKRPWGGILVNTETLCESDAKRDGNAALNMGMSVDVTTSKPQSTFVDELFAFTKTTMPGRVGY